MHVQYPSIRRCTAGEETITVKVVPPVESLFRLVDSWKIVICVAVSLLGMFTLFLMVRGNNFFEKKVSAGHSFTCGIRSNGAVKCWGKNDVGQSSAPPFPKYAFQQVSASVGGDHACGVLSDNGAIRCWGNNGRGQSENQDGTL